MNLKSLLKKISAGVSVAVCLQSSAFANAWDDYKLRYLQDDGAIIDTGNNNMTHTEGQGYGLMFALEYNDRESFDKILKWTDDNLSDPKSGLYYWAYRRDGGDPTADKNNATDGDLFIAWTLIKAGKKWNNKEYTKKGELLANLISTLTVTNYAGYNIILPGVNGFYYNSYVIVNPSYYIYPALTDLSKHTYVKLWKEINQDGRKLLNNLSNQNIKLAPDWLKLLANSENMPAEQWPARSSYDAIRVPLYLYWDNPNSPELNVYRQYYAAFPDYQTPAWVNVITGEKAGYMMSSGLKAVRDLVMGYAIAEPDISRSEDYYNASLHMMAYLAFKAHH